MLWMRPLAPLLLLVILPPAFATNSRYAAYEYDLTTPQYTPDGRLLQVEYASNACMRSDSNPLVAVGCTVPCDGEEEEAVVVMATVSSPPSSSMTPVDATKGPESKEEEVVDTSTRDGHQRTQFRIIEVPLSPSSHNGGACSILVGLSGILADATSLLQIVHSKLDEEQRVFGWHRLGTSPVGVAAVDESINGSADGGARPQIGSTGAPSIAAQPSETALRISRAIADECQKHAFGGGLRPFGASLLLAGIDPQRGRVARVGMGETHPNGGWRSHTSYLGSNGRAGTEGEATSIDRPQVVVSGGAPKAQSQLKSLVTARLNEIYGQQSSLDSIVPDERIDDNTAFLRRALQAIALSLVEEWKGRGNPVPTNEQEEHRELPQMEVVISSSKRGTFRLSERDVARLMRSE